MTLERMEKEGLPTSRKTLSRLHKYLTEEEYQLLHKPTHEFTEQDFKTLLNAYFKVRYKDVRHQINMKLLPVREYFRRRQRKRRDS